MSDVENVNNEELNKLKAEKDALQNENGSIKTVLEGVMAESNALYQTVNDILKANISLKKDNILLQNKVKLLNIQIQDLSKPK